MDRRPHEDQPGATRQPVSVPLPRRRKACRLRESQHAPTALEEPRGARCRRPWRCRNRCQAWQGRVAGIPRRVGDQALLEQICNLDRCTLRTRPHGWNLERLLQSRWEETDRRTSLYSGEPFTFAGFRVHDPRIRRSTSPECALYAYPSAPRALHHAKFLLTDGCRQC